MLGVVTLLLYVVTALALVLTIGVTIHAVWKGRAAAPTTLQLPAS